MYSQVFYSNDIAVPRDAQHSGDMAEVADDNCIRDQFHKDGYLLFRGALDRDAVLDMREAYLNMFNQELCIDGDRRAGRFSGKSVLTTAYGIDGHPAHAFVRSKLFKDFLDQPSLKQIAEKLLHADVKRVPRTPLRHFIKGMKMASRAHYDRTYMNESADTCVTLWVPLGDAPVAAGGITYLEGSHLDANMEHTIRQAGRTDRPNDNRPLTHDLKWLSETTGRRWLLADYKAGDVVAHVPDIVHASTDPTIDLMRISTDVRFVRSDIEIDPRWQNDWSANDRY